VLAVDRRIKLLLAVQIVALPLATAWASDFSGPHPVFAVLVSLIFSQAGLLGFWAAFGSSRPRGRLLCIVIGLACLSTVIPIAERGRAWLNDFQNLLVCGLVVALPALFVFRILRILQRKRGLRLVRSPPLQTTSEGFQFSIKHLMATTAIVAAIISIRKGLNSLGYGSQGPFSWFDLAVIVAVIVPCLLLVELATFWASLGLSRPFPRLMVVVPSGFLVGIVPPFYSSSEMDWRHYMLWSGITGFQALLTAATLLVFRSCGWRLCREASGDQPLPDANPICIEETESSSVLDA
jgi:hypothetical protein